MRTRWTKASDDTLIAEDEETRAWLAKRSRHAWIEGEFKEPRNGAMHRKFFALVKLVYENQEQVRDRDQFLALLKIAVGHCDVLTVCPPSMVGHQFRTSWIPKSISFAKMTQGEFEAFYDRCCDVIIRDFWPDMDKETLKAEVAEMCGAGGLSEIDRMPDDLPNR